MLMHAVCMTLVLAASAYTARGCAARCWGPAEARRRGPFHPPPGGPLGEAIRTKQTVQVADVAETQAYAARHPAVVDAVELGGVRTNFSVPMLKDNELIGIIAIYRQEGSRCSPASPTKP
jgi:GAF domain-containing protein